jgi:ATP-dependent DNA helicase UvrD/PcrA
VTQSQGKAAVRSVGASSEVSNGARIPLTSAQLEAVQVIDRNLQIVACAGAGKTQTLAERVVEILRRGLGRGIQPRNIVAFTFTERAAAELKDRIAARIRDSLGGVRGMAELFVGTIHGYCLQLLQSRVPEYFKYSVLNDVQTRLLVDRSSRKSGLTDLGLKRYVESGLYLDVLSVLREGEIDKRALRRHRSVGALEKYRQLLREKRYLDYTEILSRVVSALHDDKALQDYVAEMVKYLIVDEYQDVNPLQEALIRRIHELGANLCVVGDDDQTIYQWRGSDVRNFLDFKERYPGVDVKPIAENFRSSPGVVAAAKTVVENNAERLPKGMASAGCQPFERGDILCLELRTLDEEARWIASKIKSLIGMPFHDRPDAPARGLALSDCAILLRSVKGSAAPIVRALQEADLRLVVVGMTNLFDTGEAQAARSLFLFMVRRVSPKELRQAWLNARLGLDRKRLDVAIALMENQRKWDNSKRWSVYNLQRTYLSFLEGIALREEDVPDRRGEVVYYNLGKFSQIISDYEQIHFQSDPARKYQGFADFLTYQAPDYYPEGWQDTAYARPDAVQIMTVHQAKGMQWPVVFVPALQRNRFPAKARGFKSKWHVIPRAAVRNAVRYDGSIEDERRLFYVALTRSQKYLFCSCAPDPNKRLYSRPSPFAAELTANPNVLTRDPARRHPPHVDSRPRRELANITLSFSELKYFFECPYQFKLRFLYGFNPPLHEALGYGKSLHDALAEVHKRALAGDILSERAAEELVRRHLHVPFAYPELRDQLEAAGIEAARRYLRQNASLLDKTEHVEQTVELNLGDGLVVNGRIDLIRRTDTREIIVIDFKSTERAQEEDVTRMQLHVYTLGYKELTGNAADLIEIYNLDDGGTVREEVDRALEARTRDEIVRAGGALRTNQLRRIERWGECCGKCDLAGICRLPVAGVAAAARS